jgi:hypothetical protein
MTRWRCISASNSANRCCSSGESGSSSEVSIVIEPILSITGGGWLASIPGRRALRIGVLGPASSDLLSNCCGDFPAGVGASKMGIIYLQNLARAPGPKPNSPQPTLGLRAFLGNPR